MSTNNVNIEALLSEIESLKSQLYESNSIIEAIQDGSVDALVLNKDGRAHVYSIESADYTYRILIEKFGEGALSISDKGLILYCNDYFSKLLGIPSNKITGSYIQNYVSNKAEFDLLMSTLATGTRKGEVTLTSGDKNIHVLMSLTDLHPNVPAIGVVVTDLTEKRVQQAMLLRHQQLLEGKVHELYETNKNLEQFIHVISHDLKEPVRKISTFSSHLTTMKSHLLSEKEFRHLDIINSAALRLNSLVDDLVKYAFVATNAEEVQVPLDEVLAEVRDDLELLLDENQAIIIADKLPVIRGSRVQMRQLFSNLIVNAVKYGKDGINAIIRISSEIVQAPHDLDDSKKYHKISLSDNGIGMEVSHLTKIFTIFQRLHLRDEYSGNGIGLAICKKVMENHFGKIAVESSAEGSTFMLFFPLTD